MHKLWFNNSCSTDYGIYISGEKSFSAPERDFTEITVPGRNGVLLQDNGGYKNLSIVYPAIIHRDFELNAEAVKAWLLTAPGYARLESDYDQTHFRLAHYSGPVDFDTWFLNKSGTLELSFYCKPQRFLKSGEMPLNVRNGAALYNPTPCAALPNITVRGNGAGELIVGGTTVQIKGLLDSLVLDCDTQNAYKGAENKNATIYAPTFPTLKPGENKVSWNGGIAAVEITPRWWTL